MVRDQFIDRDAFDAWRQQHEQRCDAPLDARQAANPLYVLRNYLAQNAIAAAEQGDFNEVRRLHHILRQPFSRRPAPRPTPPRRRTGPTSGNQLLIVNKRYSF
ncbi:hypothetical protein ULF88_13165 [Halopseudomonas pachastrellae]|nr:hypothetical protein [Halopseudomonas pachastrellae]